MSAVLPFSRAAAASDPQAVLRSCLEALRAAVSEFERDKARRPRRRISTTLDGTVVVEPYPEGYLEQEDACSRLSCVLRLLELGWNDLHSLLMFTRQLDGDNASRLEQDLDQLLSRHLSLAQQTTLAAGLLRRATAKRGRPADPVVENQAGRLALVLAQLDAEDSRLVMAIAGGIGSARHGAPAVMRRALVHAIRTVLPAADVAKLAARLVAEMADAAAAREAITTGEPPTAGA